LKAAGRAAEADRLIARAHAIEAAADDETAN
jgi:hypothetical protein